MMTSTLAAVDSGDIVAKSVQNTGKRYEQQQQQQQQDLLLDSRPEGQPLDGGNVLL